MIPLPETAWQVWTQQDQTYTCFVRHPLASSLDFAVLITLVIYEAGDDQKMLFVLKHVCESPVRAFTYSKSLPLLHGRLGF